jgi:hypothetical protein
MKKKTLFACLFCLHGALSTGLAAATADEVRYLLHYGQKVLIIGPRTEENRWDRACRISRKSNYIAVVQNDTANYRIIPTPLGQIVETICPPDIFVDAIRWYDNMQKSTY